MGFKPSLQSTALWIKELNGHEKTHVVLILGSGLGTDAERIFSKHLKTMEYSGILGLPIKEGTPAIPGHQNKLLLGKVRRQNGKPLNLAIMQGRLQCSSGYTPYESVYLLRSLILNGAKTIILCSAVGGIDQHFAPGMVGIVSDHINFNGPNPLIGANLIPRLQNFPLFVDQSEIYNPQLRKHFLAQDPQGNLLVPRKCVYGMLSGPNYETPAEIQSLRKQGIHVVGMSMATEAMAANHMEARVLGLALVTNKAAGISQNRLSHQEVTAMSNQSRAALHEILINGLKTLPYNFLQ